MFYIVTNDYRRVMQIPLLKGRFFSQRDTTASTPVVLIDEVMASHVFPGQDPIGKQISMIVIGTVEIVGVVGHVKHWGLDSDDTSKIRDQIYFPFEQVPDRFMTDGVAGLTLMVRSKPEPLSLVAAVRSRVAGPGRDQPIYGMRTIEQIISNSLAERRFTMLVLAIFAASALLLAAVGIYGVSYAVTRRTHELGIRATLGASRGEIVRLVLRQGMQAGGDRNGRRCGGGPHAYAIPGGVALRRQAGHPITLAGVTILLGGIALLACYIPARRATALDPVLALRCE